MGWGPYRDCGIVPAQMLTVEQDEALHRHPTCYDERDPLEPWRARCYWGNDNADNEQFINNWVAAHGALADRPIPQEGDPPPAGHTAALARRTMQFPERNSRQEKILLAFREKGPMTIWQGIEAHGNFTSPKLPNGEEHERIVHLYCDLVERGCLLREGIVYRITVRASDHIDRRLREKNPEERSIVPPRVRNFFEKSLRIGHSARTPWRLAL